MRKISGIGKRSLPKKKFGKSYRKKDLNSYNEIVFCGYGEPACRWDDMMWLCDRIKEHGSHFIRINTNGLANLITGRRAALELDGRVDAVSVSLNASTPEDTTLSATANSAWRHSQKF